MLTSKDITFTPGNHRYHVKDTKPKQYIPSVTTVCGMLDKPFLIQWAANCASEAAVRAVAAHGDQPLGEDDIEKYVNAARRAHQDVREEGGKVGTVVHNHVKSVLVPGWTPPEDEAELDGGLEAEMAISCFDEWHEKYVVGGGLEILLVEQVAVHPEGKYVGTLDVCALAPADWSPTGRAIEVIDWKTSNQSESNPLALYPEYFFQIAAYRRLLQLSPEFDELFGGHPFGGAQQVSLGKNGQLGVTPLDEPTLEACADAFERLATILGTYRDVQGQIRAFNKAEKERRALAAL